MLSPWHKLVDVGALVPLTLRVEEKDADTVTSIAGEVANSQETPFKVLIATRLNCVVCTKAKG